MPFDENHSTWSLHRVSNGSKRTRRLTSTTSRLPFREHIVGRLTSITRCSPPVEHINTDTVILAAGVGGRCRQQVAASVAGLQPLI